MLLQELRSEDHQSRRDAALSLGILGQGRDYDSTVEKERVVDALLVSMGDPVPEVRAAAVWALDELNPSRWSDQR
jgi:HEAT repeat protein